MCKSFRGKQPRVPPPPDLSRHHLGCREQPAARTPMASARGNLAPFPGGRCSLTITAPLRSMTAPKLQPVSSRKPLIASRKRLADSVVRLSW